MKMLFKITAVILIQAFMIGLVYALPIDGKRGGEPICLSPSLGLPQQYIQNIFGKAQKDTAGIKELSLFLDSWLKKNKKRAEQLRLDEIKNMAEADFRSIRLEIKRLEERLTPLLKTFEEYPSQNKSKQMVKFIKEDVEMKRKFCNGIAEMIYENFGVFNEKLPEYLSDLRNGKYTRASYEQVMEFALKTLTNEEFKTYILPVGKRTLESHINDFKHIEKRKEEVFASLAHKKNKYPKRWKKNDLDLVSEEIIKLRRLIEFDARYEGVFTGWINIAIPDWETGFEEIERHLTKIKSINKIQAVDIFANVQECVRLIAPFIRFLRTDSEKTYEKINILVAKLVQKIDLCEDSENISCFFINEELLRKISSTTPNITEHIVEAEKKGKQVVVFGLRQDVINLFCTRGGSKAEEFDAVKAKVLLLEGHTFFDIAKSIRTYGFLKTNHLVHEQITVLSLAVFSCLEMISEQGVDLSGLKLSKSKAQFGIFSSELVYSLFKKGFRIKEREEVVLEIEYLIEKILALMPDEAYNKLIKKILSANNRKFLNYALAICGRDTLSSGDILNNRFKKMFLKMALCEQDPILLSRIRPRLIEFWNYDMIFFYLAADYYSELDKNQRRRLIELIFELDPDMIDTEKLEPVILLLTKDTDGLGQVFAFINAIYVLCKKSGDSEFGRVRNLWKLLDNVHVNTYYLLRFFAGLVPRSEVISSSDRGETAEAVMFLDDGRIVAKIGEKTIFTDIRIRVHQNPDSDHRALLGRLLHYWHDQDKERLLLRAKDPLLYDFAREDFREYNYAIKRLYEELKDSVSDRISDKDLDYFEVFLRMVDKKNLLDKVKEINKQLCGEISLEDGLLYSKMEAYVKTAWTILAYQGVIWRFESNWIRAKQNVYEADLRVYPQIKELRGNFINTIEKEKSDVIDVLRSYTDLRKAVYVEIIQNGSQIDLEEKVALFEFDIGLEQFFVIYFQNFISKAFDIHNIQGLKEAAVLLALQLRNLCFSGLGNAALEEFAQELESGPLFLSQYLNIINSVEFETRKIVKNICMDFEGQISSVAKRSDVNRFKENYLDILNSWGSFKNSGYHYEMDDAIANKLEEVVIGKIIREAGFPILESSLVSLSEAVKERLEEQGDLMLRPKPEIKSMAELFKRFGSNEKDVQVDLLSTDGKKALRLAKMAEAGLPVPPGVIISADLCHNQKILNNPEFIRQLEKEIEHLQEEGELLFARSGSAYSFPGLLTTISNLGMNEEEVERLAKQTEDEWFAYDAYGNFLRAYGTYVLDIPVDKFQDILNLNTREKPQAIEGMKALVERYKNLISSSGKVVPNSLLEQVRGCLPIIYNSWNSAEAIQYRQKHSISSRWGTAVILEKAEFGNMQETKDGRFSGAGAATLRFDEYNQLFMEGRFIFRSQGEALMSGAPGNYVCISKEEANAGEFSLEEKDSKTYAKLFEYGRRLYGLFRQPQRFEFTMRQGKIYLLQSSDSDEFDEADLPRFIDQPQVEPIAKGRGAAGGAFRGIAAVNPDSARKLHQEFLDGKYDHLDIDGIVLILDRVNPEDINKIPKNTAIISKEMSIHCETLAHKNGISACYHFPNMEFSDAEQGGSWQIQDTVFNNGDVLSFDGHVNRHVYHKSGFLYKVIISLKERKNKSMPRADNKTEIVNADVLIERAI